MDYVSRSKRKVVCWKKHNYLIAAIMIFIFGYRFLRAAQIIFLSCWRPLFCRVKDLSLTAAQNNNHGGP